MPADLEYERREIALAHKEIKQVNAASLRDRQDAARDFFEAMRDTPQIVGQRVGWLIAGNYGYGSKLLAEDILHSPRMNRTAALTQLVGVFEWQSPERMTRQAWKRLTGHEKALLATAVDAEIHAALHADD